LHVHEGDVLKLPNVSVLLFIRVIQS